VRKLLALGALLVFAVPASATTSRILAPLDWWPVWSPDGSYLAFTRVYANHMELYTLDLRTHGIVRIGTNAGQLGPTWSHDGSQLAYASGGVLWVAGADGAGKHRYFAPQKAYAPAWRPASTELAYLSTAGATNTDLWVANLRWARNAIGFPSWSPDGQQLAFQRDDGIYVATGRGSVRQLVSIANPGPPSWSNDGTRIAYVASGRLYTVASTGGTPRLTATATLPAGTPSWSRDDRRVTTTGAWSPVADVLVTPGPRPACPGHVVLREGGRALTGSCVIAGTPKADVIEGTPLWGDVIEAGAGNDSIHANDGHTDRVDCGPGRDTVWADRTDKLSGCEVVHR
jgi:Tol biopolymer transport system component